MEPDLAGLAIRRISWDVITTPHPPTGHNLAYGLGAQIPADRIDDDRIIAEAIEVLRLRVPAPVSAWIDQHVPRALAGFPDASEFLRGVVLATEPLNPFSASVIAVAVGGLIEWARLSEGLPLRRGVLLNRQVTDMYLGVLRSSKAVGTVSNYRGYLARAAAAFGIGIDATPIRGRSVAKPYAPEREAMFAAWARAQATPLAVDRAFALFGLAAGAGLSNAEIAGVQARHVVDAGALWVRVRGGRDRMTPVREAWAPYLRRRLTMLRPDELVFPSGDSQSTNLVKEWVGGLPGRERPVPGRLRASWLVSHLRAQTPPERLLEWSGLERGETIADYLPFAPEAASEQLRRTYVHLRAPRSEVI